MTEETLVVALDEYATPLPATVTEWDGDDLVAAGDGDDLVAAGDGDDLPAVGDGDDLPAAGDGDAMSAVAGHLDGAAVVGLGEAAHGSRELFGLKWQLLRLLVGRGGVRTLALEADPAATVAVDEYVRRGTGDPMAALRDLVIWPWKTREFRAVVARLRSVNEGRPPADRVGVRGVGVGGPADPAERVLSFLRAVDPDYAARADGLATLADDGADALADAGTAALADEGAGTDDQPHLDEAARVARTVAERLDERRSAYVDAHASERATDARATAERRWRTAKYLSLAIERACEWHRVRGRHDGPHAEGMAERDRLMAENVAWCRRREPGDGVAVWAHNSHVQRGTFDDGTRWSDVAAMGEHLDRAFGDDYRPLATDFGRGSVRAIDGSADGRDPGTFAVGEPLAGSLTAHLDALDAPRFLDLGAAADDARLSGLLAEGGRIRWVGSVYRPEAAAGTHYQRTDLPASYDTLCFVPESTPTRPLDAGD